MMRQAVPGCFSPLASMQHYRSMTERTWHAFLEGEQVRLKKYLYVLRPVLCCRWIERWGTMLPVAFDELYAAVLPEEMRPTVDALLRRKMAVNESGLTAHIPELDEFLLGEMARIRQAVDQVKAAPAMDWADVNRLFRQVIHMAWET